MCPGEAVPIEGGGDAGTRGCSQDRVPPNGNIGRTQPVFTLCSPPNREHGDGTQVSGNTVAGHGRGEHSTVDLPLLASTENHPPSLYHRGGVANRRLLVTDMRSRVQSASARERTVYGRSL